MDIRKEIFNDTAVIDDFTYPDGKPIMDETTNLPVTIEIYGTHTDQFQNVVDKTVWLARQNKKDDKEAKEPTVAEAAAEKLRVLKNIAALVVGWSGFYDNGTPLECSIDNAVKLFQSAPYIKERIDQSITKKQLYFTRSSEK